MKDRRLQIKEALESMIYGQRHRDFQRLAVHLAKTKWPELEATQEQDDGGEDATSFFVAEGGIKRRGACSLTGTLDKVRKDAARLKERKVQLDVLVFMTPVPITNLAISDWCEAVQKEFQHGLHVIAQAELVTLLEQPQNAWLCRDYLHLNFAEEPMLAELEASARAAAAKLLRGWKLEYQYDQNKAIELGFVLEPAESGRHREPQAQIIHVSLRYIGKLIDEGNHVLLIGPPGAGKTFTLIQSADSLLQDVVARVPFLVSLPGWAASGGDFLPYVAKQLEVYGLDTDRLAKLNNAGRITFILNGWNEIPDSFTERASSQLRSFILNNSAAKLILSTREGRVATPLSSASVIRLRPLSSQQKLEIIKKSGLENSSALVRELETNIALSEVTDTPLFLTAVIDLARAGVSLPGTRSGILKKFIEQVEGSSEHSAALNAAPCAGLHRRYLNRIAAAMTQTGRTTAAFDELLGAIAECSKELQSEGHLTLAPHSPSVVDCLVKHHLLVHSPSLGGDYRFVHQQFQEWFAAEWLHSRVVALAKDERPDTVFALQGDILNHVRWQQPLSFLLERLSEGDNEQRRIAAKLISWAMQVDLLLASELAGVAGERVWPLVRNELNKSLREWHARKSERRRHCALAAMLATRASDFQDILWPLLESADQQERLLTCRT